MKGGAEDVRDQKSGSVIVQDRRESMTFMLGFMVGGIVGVFIMGLVTTAGRNNDAGGNDDAR